MSELSASARGYGRRWQAARLRFLQANPLCERCQQDGRVVAASVVDHIVPHRLGAALKSGDPGQIAAARRLFNTRGNLSSLCSVCHDGAKQRQEKSGLITGISAAGIPVDPAHHWNR